MRLPVLLMILMLLAGSTAAASEAAYDAWMQNRPDEAVPLLFETAQKSGAWYNYYDLGLAAHANQQRGLAVAWLLKAHLLAPAESAPREALAAIDSNLPTTWLDKLGPLSWPGTGMPGLLIMLLSGISCGLILFLPEYRWTCTIILAVGLVLALPGSIAHSLDSQRQLHACVSAAPLLDATGQPLQTLAPGTIVSEERRLANGRMLVQLANGKRGFLDQSYCDARPRP